MSTTDEKARVAIVLCTYNGADHIKEQLDSIQAQSWPVALRVFDDGSTDKTIDILQSYKPQLDLSITVRSKNLGYVANFESGIAQVIDEGFNYTAPALAHSDLRMIDSTGQCVQSSFFKYRHYEIGQERALATVLGQNGVMGNTILMNRALATMANPFPEELHVHDYWFAVLAELHGHRVLIDQPLVNYRIHDSNASNSNDSIKFGLAKTFDGKSWQGLVNRDFRLPFKEDDRLNVIDTVISENTRFPKLIDSQVQLLTTFRNYLVFKEPRLKLLHSMLNAGFFRKGFRHRIRLCFSTLFTKRYN